jgi:hypothetical protein
LRNSRLPSGLKRQQQCSDKKKSESVKRAEPVRCAASLRAGELMLLDCLDFQSSPSLRKVTYCF